MLDGWYFQIIMVRDLSFNTLKLQYKKRIHASTRLRYWKSFIETGNFCQTQVNTRIQTHQVTHKVSHSIVYSSTVSQSDEFREVMDLDKRNEHSLIFRRNLIPIIYTFYNYRIMVITWKKTQAWNKTRKEE